MIFFSILEKTAIVVFYPLDDENDGFHIQRTLKGKSADFVYINTSKAIEKQIFTAAHELGHRLGVESYISEFCKNFDVLKYRENVVNRNSKVEKDLAKFKSECDVIIANRKPDELADGVEKIYTRDLMGRE